MSNVKVTITRKGVSRSLIPVSQNRRLVVTPSSVPTKKAGCSSCAARRMISPSVPMVPIRVAGAPPAIISKPALTVPESKIFVQGTEEWGTITWELLHKHASYYSDSPTPDESKRKLAFFKSLFDDIPCHVCREETLSYLRGHPLELAMKNGCTLSKWVLDFHNHVNVRLAKPIWSMEAMAKHFKLTRVPCA